MRAFAGVVMLAATLGGCGNHSILTDGGPGALGEIGAACSTNNNCALGLTCLPASTGFPDGYCSEQCATSNCPAGSVCGDLTGTGLGNNACLASCLLDSDCRGGYVCCANLSHSCAPAAGLPRGKWRGGSRWYGWGIGRRDRRGLGGRERRWSGWRFCRGRRRRWRLRPVGLHLRCEL